MGALRMMLAICVCIYHANPSGLPFFLSGGAAVYIFFVISGYYMQMVLDVKYSRVRLGDGWLKSFYLARYFRLFPAYAVACVALMGIIAWGGLDGEVLSRPVQHGLDLFTSGHLKDSVYGAFLVFSNLTMFGLNMPSVADILVAPSWTLGVELSFYAIAPVVLNKSNRILTCAVILGLSLRFIPYNTHTPLFAGIDMFCLGALVYRGRDSLRLMDKVFLRLKPLGVFVFLMAVVTFSLPRWDFLGIAKTHNELDVLVYPFVFALIIPALFRFSEKSRVDRFVGELSYPFYIFHQLVVDVLMAQGAIPYLREGAALTVAATTLTIAIALTFYLIETRYIEPIRGRLSASPTPPSLASSLGLAQQMDAGSPTEHGEAPRRPAVRRVAR